MSSTVGRIVVGVYTNKSGGAVALGDVVILDSANDASFTTTTTGAYTGMLGVVIEANGIASNASGRVQTQGDCAVVNLNASGTRGHYVKTHTVAKQGTDAGTSRVVGAFGQLLTTGATPRVLLFGFPDAASSSAAAGTPALTLSTTNSAGAASTFVATDATVAVFDATSPTTQAFGDAAAVGTAGTAARRDHKHAMMAASAAAPSEYESFLSADRTIISGSTWYSSASLAVTPAAGDYEITACVSLTSARSSATILYGGIGTGGSLDGNGAWTGGTALATAHNYNPASNGGGGASVCCVARATLDGSTAVRALGLSGAGSSDSKIITTDLLGIVANKASSIHCRKITST